MWRKGPGHGEEGGERRRGQVVEGPRGPVPPRRPLAGCPGERGARKRPGGRRLGCSLPTGSVPRQPLRTRFLQASPRFFLNSALCPHSSSQFRSPFEADGCPGVNSSAIVCMFVNGV